MGFYRDPPDDPGIDYTRLSASRPVAAKQHTCYICQKPILVGEKHEKEVGICDGQFQSLRYHLGMGCSYDLD